MWYEKGYTIVAELLTASCRRIMVYVMGYFRDHLKDCIWCERHPFNLCSTGISCRNTDRLDRKAPGTYTRQDHTFHDDSDPIGVSIRDWKWSK
jgi:hypothetical protein